MIRQRLHLGWLRLLLVAFHLLLCSAAPAQIAPGPLSRAHASLDGLTKCGSCHEFGGSSRSFKCLDCHVEVRSRIEGKRGFHGREVNAAAGVSAECRRCHQEHKGQTTPLIRLDRQKFDHLAKTGFELVGKHRQQKCEACHVASHMTPAARAEIKVKDPNHSFLGLRRDCLGCHKDQHQSQLGTDCLRCHNQDAFKPAAGFDHSSTRFPLTGQHRSQACQKCHGPKPGQETAQYKGLAFAGCNNCHNDPHRGAFQEAKFRGSCDTCHTTAGFKANQPGSEFNHALARFKPVGKHAELTCAKCHKSADFKRPIPHERCADCHEDRHNGQFLQRAAGSDCASCHNENGFKPVRFDRETHRRAAFPLEGKHAGLECAKCHEPQGRVTVYMIRKLTCPACHTDRHGGEFAGAPHFNKCDECHVVDGFQKTTYTVEVHAKTRFPLTGKHAAVACEKCHKPMDTPGPQNVAAKIGGTEPAPPRQHRFASLACKSCHNDPHQTVQTCETCHTPEAFKPARAFDHSTTKFRLEGAHQPLQCMQCHKTVQPAAAAVGQSMPPAPDFSSRPTNCSSCHREKDAHGGQFLDSGRVEECSTCHVIGKWNGDNFSHDKTGFILNRVHREVACARCHKQQREVNGKQVRIYRGTTTECVQCH